MGKVKRKATQRFNKERHVYELIYWTKVLFIKSLKISSLIDSLFKNASKMCCAIFSYGSSFRRIWNLKIRADSVFLTNHPIFRLIYLRNEAVNKGILFYVFCPLFHEELTLAGSFTCH